ncbi:MAG: threonine synthase [Kiritimatiellae bacterium]|nr:threonine synthase [Kiritimatiellia bacterium]
MKYISTRGETDPIGFRDAVLMGMARDGGLLLPESIPDISDKLSAWRSLSYIDLASEIMSLYADIPLETIRSLLQKSYSTFRDKEITPVVQIGDMFVLELFHGPTLAFKDIALQYLGNIFEMILSERKVELNILAATSGDTGSAAIQGCRGRDNIRIFVMHPHGKVSDLQERQMTSVLDSNVFNIAVDGNFDDCQKIMKTIFGDLEFRDLHSMGTVNSINWARVLAQIVYYFYAAFRVMDKTSAHKVRFSVPTGNFGDILAGYIASRMGLPVGGLVLATNENDILSRFFNTGTYSSGTVLSTISPSMDIQVASNFERYLYYRTGEDPSVLRDLMKKSTETGSLSVELDGGAVDPLFLAGAGDHKGTLATIRKIYEAHEYLLDPHSAVGVHVAERFMIDDEPMICLATAHPAKFPAAIEEAVGKDIAHHPILDALKDLPTRSTVLPSTVDAIRAFVQENV